jgi:hypothetical protein
MVGLIDWEAIVDRTRYLRKLATWDSPQEILKAVARQFRYDLWADQGHYLEVWVEKDAALGVVEAICDKYRVSYLACRGYASASEIWRAGHQRFRPKIKEGKVCKVIYLGDHDPSGIDMPNDLRKRLDVFTGFPGEVDVVRLALNMDQVEQYDPPPAPAKVTDSRAKAYVKEFGEDSWELDALDATVMRDLIEDEIRVYRDEAVWAGSLERENEAKLSLAVVAKKWDAVTKHLKKDIAAAADVPDIFEDL